MKVPTIVNAIATSFLVLSFVNADDPVADTEMNTPQLVNEGTLTRTLDGVLDGLEDTTLMDTSNATAPEVAALTLPAATSQRALRGMKSGHDTITDQMGYGCRLCTSGDDDTYDPRPKWNKVHPGRPLPGNSPWWGGAPARPPGRRPVKPPGKPGKP